MAMILSYGSYSHASQQVSIASWNRRREYSENGYLELLRISANFRAKIIGVNMADVMQQAYVMQTAYSINGQSLVMRDTVAGITVWTLDSPSSIGGVIVTNPVSYHNVEGAEGITYLNCTFGLEAVYLLANQQNVLSFHETVTYTDCGGLPLFAYRIPSWAIPSPSK